jgi:hypothetical protein
MTLPKIETMNSGAKDDLWCMFKHGPTWDGDLPSKSGRDWLVERGYVERGMGWNWLTTSGALLAIECGMGKKKESRK